MILAWHFPLWLFELLELLSLASFFELPMYHVVDLIGFFLWSSKVAQALYGCMKASKAHDSYLGTISYIHREHGIASVVELISMMTDHYCNSVVLSGVFTKGWTRDSLFDCKQNATAYSSAKKARKFWQRVEKYIYPSRQSLKLQADDIDDDVKITLVLKGASQRGGSPQVFQTPNCRTDSAMSSLDMGNAKLLSYKVDREVSMEPDTRELLRYKNDLAENGTIDRTTQKPRRLYEGQQLVGVMGKLKMEAADEKNSRTSLQGPRKRSKKALYRRDEDSPFDARQTLAGLSLMIPTTENEDDEDSPFDARQTLAGLSLMIPTTENEDGKDIKFFSIDPCMEACSFGYWRRYVRC
ncbi:hypothetical protein RND71_007937 [Anisodus tanguticus]|uniref:Uncharacterized protein n=1 Tax=Anisodus tanguticus TaxID=243964 RepID=A0AAE1SJW0_9SOLA|nr:hypothetical protein RND71_007937 [Anisodus tanguticus]